MTNALAELVDHVLIPYQQDGPLGLNSSPDSPEGETVLIPYQQDGPLGPKKRYRDQYGLSLNPLSAGWSVRTFVDFLNDELKTVLIPYQQDGPLGLKYWRGE